MSFTLPYTGIIKETENFSPQGIDAVSNQCLGLSTENPCYIELRDPSIQCFLFFREGQIYAAGKIQDRKLFNTTIKEFFLGCSQMHDPSLRIYAVNSKILHSILILFQKKPSIKTSSSLVDLDKLLDEIEEKGKSCIVSATQDDFLAILRYEKGHVTALCHERSYPVPKEGTFREDFLVKIYTLAAEKQLFINLYEDLLVKFSPDAKIIDEDFHGNISDLFLSKPPILLLKFKGKELGQRPVDKSRITIGRSNENDIVIDNLAVSRLHAVIEEDKGAYYVRDCDSLNGTVLNGRKIGRSRLHLNDVIVIGKHHIFFMSQDRVSSRERVQADNYDHTFIISPQEREKMKLRHARPLQNHHDGKDKSCESSPRLIEKTENGDRVIELLKPNTILGKDKEADIPINGLFIAGKHAEITKEGERYIIRHLHGARRIKVCGKTISESVLRSNDKITIANREFIFIE